MKMFLTSIVLLACAGFALASGSELTPSITVSGVGKISYVPDMGYIHVGVSTDGATTAEAWQKNEQAVKKIFAALKELGIEEKDFKTTNLNIQPRYLNKPNQPPKLIGYTVSYDLSVRVRRLNQMSELLGRMVDAGANQNMNISFGCSKIDELMEQARLKAVTDARKKASLYVTAAGAKLGDVLAISDTPLHHHRPYLPIDAKAVREGVAGLPVAAGEQELSVNVTIRWGIVN